jgi:hypothetical protein
VAGTPLAVESTGKGHKSVQECRFTSMQEFAISEGYLPCLLAQDHIPRSLGSLAGAWNLLYFNGTRVTTSSPLQNPRGTVCPAWASIAIYVVHSSWMTATRNQESPIPSNTNRSAAQSNSDTPALGEGAM